MDLKRFASLCLPVCLITCAQSKPLVLALGLETCVLVDVTGFKFSFQVSSFAFIPAIGSVA